MKQLITLFITLCLFTTCSGSGKQQETALTVTTEKSKTEIPVFDLAGVVNKQVPDTFTWNSIAKSIKLIPISTSRGTLMGISQELIYIGDDFYIIAEYQTQTIYRTDLNGKILKSFRHVGNGPGEYTYLSRTNYIPEDSTIQVFDNGNMKRIFYDLNGKLIKEISMKDMEINFPLLIKENYMICRGNPESPYQLYITDNDLNIQQRLCPLDSTLTTWEKAAIVLQTNRSINKDVLIFNHATSDSVFTVTDKGFSPLFILKKGDYTIPQAELKNFINLIKQGDPHILALRIHSIPGYYLIAYNRNKQFIEEIWRESDCQIISRFFNTNDEFGYPFTLPSGKTIRINTTGMYKVGNTIALFIPAEDAAGEIPGVKEDDNPVLLIMEI